MLNSINQETIIEQFKRLNTPLIASIVLLLIGIAIVLTGYRSIQPLFFPDKITKSQEVYSPIKQVNIKDLKGYHLMGIAPTITLNNIPLSQLGYTLKSILMGDKGIGQAVITVKGKDIVASVKSVLAPGIIVNAVTPRTVIISNHGSLGKLEMIAPLDFSKQKPPETLFSGNNQSVIIGHDLNNESTEQKNEETNDRNNINTESYADGDNDYDRNSEP